MIYLILGLAPFSMKEYVEESKICASRNELIVTQIHVDVVRTSKAT